MKNLKKELITICVIFMSLSFFTANAQEDKKLTKAETTFCASLTDFVQALITLDAIEDNSTMDEFNAAYKSANKAWNKLQKKAAKLEKVEIKESVKAYNKLVDAVNNMDDSMTTKEANAQIDDHIDATAAQITDIQTVICN